MSNDEIVADLTKAFAAKPELKELVHKDPDLALLLDQEEFKKLVFGP